MNYHSASVEQPEKALMAAFKMCGKIARKADYSQIGLAVPTKSNLDGIISGVIGEDATSILQRDNELELKGFTVHLITERVKPKNFKGPVLAAYVTLEQINKIVK